MADNKNCNSCLELERENSILKAKLIKSEKREQNYRVALESVNSTAAFALDDNDSEYDEMLIALKAVNGQQAGTSSAPQPKKTRTEDWACTRTVLLSAYSNKKVCVLRELYLKASSAEERDRFQVDINTRMDEMGVTGEEERYRHLSHEQLLGMVEESIAELLSAD